MYRPEEMVLPFRRVALVIPPIPPELGGCPNGLGWPKLLLGIDGAAWTWGGSPPPHLIPWTWLCCTRGTECPKGLDGVCGTGSCGIGFWTRSTKSEPHWWQFHGSRTESLRASQLKTRYFLCLLWLYPRRNSSLVILPKTVIHVFFEFEKKEMARMWWHIFSPERENGLRWLVDWVKGKKYSNKTTTSIDCSRS